MAYRRIPSLNWLRVFEAAARMESFSGAARILNMSAAAVSQQVKALESHLNTRLFERGARNVTLTDEGASFLPAVRQSLLSVENTAAALFGHGQKASVTVQATLIFAVSWLAERLAEFEADHPGIQVHVMGSYSDDDTDRDGPDLNIVFSSAPRSWGDSEYLFGETIYPVARPDIAGTISQAGDFLDHRLIEISTHRTSWIQMLEAAGVRELDQARFCFVDSSDIALAMAARGYGVALARAPATDGHMAQLGLERCGPDMELIGSEAYHLVCLSVANLSKPAQQFRTWLLEEARRARQEKDPTHA